MVSLLEGVSPDQLGDPTPCTEYTVADLIHHVDVVARGASALARQAEEATHTSAIDDVRDLALAWDDPEAWEGTGNVPGSDLSNETWGKIALTEMVVHGWDLAQATGQPYSLPDESVRACLEHVADFVPHAPVPALWGPPRSVAHDADLLDQVLAITGR